MHSHWRCDRCGPVPPWHVAERVSAEIVESAVRVAAESPTQIPVWCLWPLPPGWTVTGVGWVGDDRYGANATALSCSGPDPLGVGPADVVLIAEEPGVGLGARFAGVDGLDPGPGLARAVTETSAHAKIKAAGWPTPLWAIATSGDRCAHVGEAKGLWLYAVAWPASAGYLLAEDVVLHDLTEWLPPELVYGAPSPYLHGMA